MRMFSKPKVVLIGLGIATGMALTAVAYAAPTFGPSRPTFTQAKPATHITFNSITDNNLWGDERFLVKARDVNSGTNTYSNNVQVSDNQELLVTTYFHNNAASNLNLVAKDVKARIVLPNGNAATQSLTSYISSSNANPSEVFATMDFASGQPFTLEYETGSARLVTNFVNTSLSDSVVNGGTMIGSKGTDGKVPGCAEFSGYVTIKVRVHVQKVQPQFACTGLDVTQIDRSRYDFTAHGSATNATIQSYAFTTKDGNGTVVDTNTVNSSANSAVYHFNQSNPGTYTVSAVVTTDKGSTGQTSICTKQITVQSPPTTPTTPTTPSVGKEIPNTGAGSTIAIFAGVSALAGLGHYIWNGRRARI